MNLLEHEAKSILSQFAIPRPRGEVVRPGDAAPISPIVLKSQVHTGGRGKLGGVRVVPNGDTALIMSELFALMIKDELPRTLLAEELLDIDQEYYLSLMIDRSLGSVEVVAHREGGIEVEAHESSEFFRHELTPTLTSVVGDILADYLDLSEKSFALQDLLTRLYQCFVESDALLLEINPLVLTKSGQLVAGDCKMTLDDDAGFRHPEWQFEAEERDANFITLDPDGTVATIANGAGLAMATVDAIHAAGFTPANFLDVGGGATVEGMVANFEKIGKFPKVTAIVINIFGGIVRCDTVAEAILAAREKVPGLPNLYIRLSGTNSDEAAQLLSVQGMTLYANLDEVLAGVRHG